MGSSRYRVPPELREAVARLMRDSDLSMGAIAVTTGLSLSTLNKWNKAEGWRPVRTMRRDWDTSLPRLAALERLARARRGPDPAPRGVTLAGAEPGAAVRAATSYEAAARDAGDLPMRPGDTTADLPPGLPTDFQADLQADLPTHLPADLPALRAALRAHVGRQIAAFDAALRGEGAAVIDSARVLRDLGGLKRLLDDLGGEGGDDGGAPGPDGEPDLPALRAEIARRCERLHAGGADAGAAGEPAAAAAAALGDGLVAPGAGRPASAALGG